MFIFILSTRMTRKARIISVMMPKPVNYKSASSAPKKLPLAYIYDTQPTCRDARSERPPAAQSSRSFANHTISRTLRPSVLTSILDRINVFECTSKLKKWQFPPQILTAKLFSTALPSSDEWLLRAIKRYAIIRQTACLHNLMNRMLDPGSDDWVRYPQGIQ